MIQNAGEGGAKMEKKSDSVVYMWGYLPGSLPEKSLILSPEPVRLPVSVDCVESWKEVCGGGCGFAMAISESGKLITWGAADEEGQSYLTSGKHGETPEAFPLPTETSVVKADAGWAHCVSVTETGEVYTWGWSECIPSVKTLRDLAIGGGLLKDSTGKLNVSVTEQGDIQISMQISGKPLQCVIFIKNMAVSNGPQNSKIVERINAQVENRRVGEETLKRRKTSSVKEDAEISSPGDELFTALPCLVALGPGVKITAVAAGGRHTLVLSGKSMMPGVTHMNMISQVWGWGHGGEGQLGLGSRVKMVSSPHVIPCIELPTSAKDRSSVTNQGSKTAAVKMLGNYVKAIACGGRHSVVVTDSGALLTFGWGLYGQCGQRNTNDLLRPTCVSSLSGTQVESIAAGLWHTVCVTKEGLIYAFGGNQFGQLGTGADQDETVPRLLDAPSLESKHAKIVSSGARHNAVLTEDGQLFSWGWNKYGQLGLGDSIDRNIPSKVSIDGCFPRNVSCGWWHTLLLAKPSM